MKKRGTAARAMEQRKARLKPLKKAMKSAKYANNAAKESGMFAKDKKAAASKIKKTGEARNKATAKYKAAKAKGRPKTKGQMGRKK